MSKYLSSSELIFIISSPSGGGKSSLINSLLKITNNISLSISTTTRAPRPAEEDGIHYNFVNESDFIELINNNLLLEYAKIYGNYYGTTLKQVDDILSKGQDIIFDINWDGARQIKDVKKDAILIFILPPSIIELENRLRSRAQDSNDSIKNRLNSAAYEITFASYYDYVVVNDEFEDTLKQLYSIVISERIKKHKLNYLNIFANSYK